MGRRRRATGYSQTEPSEAEANGNPASDDEGGGSYAGDVIRSSLLRFVLPGLCVVGAGYALASFGWSATWMLTLYVSVALVLVLGQGFLRLRRSNQLRDLLFVSLFFLLSTPFAAGAVDPNGPLRFQRCRQLCGTPIPFILALLTNLILAMGTCVMLD